MKVRDLLIELAKHDPEAVVVMRERVATQTFVEVSRPLPGGRLRQKRPPDDFPFIGFGHPRRYVMDRRRGKINAVVLS